MLLIIHFFLGTISSFLGSLAPSMLNMTAAKISLKSGKNDAKKFALGASLVVFIQAYIAILFTKYLKTNPSFIQVLQQIALVIFIFLTVYFYRQYKTDKNPNNEIKQGYKNSFIIGLFLSSLNMFSIPFYCGITTALDVIGWLEFSTQYIISFVVGSTIGPFYYCICMPILLQ
jgi:threonine/homoserine/homoserine lactone efflux protein